MGPLMWLCHHCSHAEAIWRGVGAGVAQAAISRRSGADGRDGAREKRPLSPPGPSRAARCGASAVGAHACVIAEIGAPKLRIDFLFLWIRARVLLYFVSI
eukprot:1230683-Prymnesium_polylepis.1